MPAAVPLLMQPGGFMGPQHQRQVLALDLYRPVAAKRDRYVDEGLIALTGLLGVNPVDFVPGR